MGRISRFCLKTALVSTGICAVFIITMALAALFLVWQMTARPVEVSFGKGYIEKALSGIDDNYQVKLDKIVLHWPEIAGPIFLKLDTVQVLEKGNAAALEIDRAVIGVSRSALLVGKIKPKSLLLEAPALQIVREDDGLSLLVEGQEVAEEEAKKDKNMRDDILAMLEDISDAQMGGRTLSRLRSFEIRDAQVAIRDFVNGTSWYLTDFDFMVERSKERLRTNLALQLPGGTKKTAGIRVDASYIPSSKESSVLVYLQDMDPVSLSRFVDVGDVLKDNTLTFNGQISAFFDSALGLQRADIVLTSAKGQLSIPSQYDTPLSYTDLNIEASCASCSDSIDVKSFKAVVENVALEASSQISVSDTEVKIPLNVSIADLPLERIGPLFPKSELDGQAAKWLLQRLTGGRFYDAKAVIEVLALKKEEKWDVDLPEARIDFSFEDVDVAYSSTLMPAKKTKGSGFFDLASEVIEVNGESGWVGGDVEATDISVKLKDIMVVGGGYADIKMKLKGPLVTTLRYAAREPIGFGGSLGFDLDQVKGDVDLNLSVGLPTKKDLPKEEVKVKISGPVKDVHLPDAVKGLELTGGPLDLHVDDGSFSVKGSGQLAGRAVTLDWMQYFNSKDKPHAMQVKAQIGADQQLRHHFNIHLDDYISGTMPVDVTYTDKGNGVDVLDVIGDLGPVKLMINPFDYEKMPGIAGQMRFKGMLRNDMLEEIQNLTLKTEGFSLAEGHLVFEKTGTGTEIDLRRGTLPVVVLGKTAANAEFEITKDDVLKIIAKGPVIDAEPFLNDENKKTGNEEEAQATAISITTPKLLTKNGQSIQRVKLYVESDKIGDVTQLEMDAMAGSGDIYLRFKPNEQGKRVFRLEAADAGATLRAFDVYDNMKGGTLLVYGEPIPGTDEQDVSGIAHIENFSVTKTPALARLIAAMSLTGLGEALNKEGLSFTKFESHFEWKSLAEGSLIKIRNGKTSGSSLGLSLEGSINRGSKEIDLKGTIVPLSEVSSLIGSIPLIGDILTGGPGGGLIAATYTMKGPMKDPKVSVNPLSVLTPGILRTILFEGGYEDDIPPDYSRDAN